jgi:hypothetical protein
LTILYLIISNTRIIVEGMREMREWREQGEMKE